jgi:hypothetical protein
MGQFAGFLAVLCGDAARAREIVGRISPVTFALFLAFAINARNCGFLVNLLIAREEFVPNAFRVVDLIAMVTGRDFHAFQNALMHDILARALQPAFSRDRQWCIDCAVGFIAFRPRIPGKVREGKLELEAVIESLSTPGVVLPQPQYSLKIVGEKWVDLNIVKLLIDNVAVIVDLRIEKLIVLLSFACHRAVAPIENLVPALDQFAARVGDESKVWNPVILNIARNPRFAGESGLFFRKFRSRLHISDGLLNAANDELANFAKSVPARSRFDESILQLLNSEPRLVRPALRDLAEVLQSIRKKSSSLQKHFQNRWISIWRALCNQNALLNPKKPSYRRRNRFDRHLLPTLLLPDLADYVPLARRVPPKQKVANDIWHAECEMLDLATVNRGTFCVADGEFSFLGDDGQSFKIFAGTVSHVFWCWFDQRPEGFQLFTLDYQGYLFRFPGQTSHEFVANLKKIALPNLVFFQAAPPSAELERLGLVQGWKTRKLTTSEYLLWLNLLSGRSFMDLRIYPIFPRLLSSFSGDTFDPNRDSTFRDFSRSSQPAESLEKIVSSYLGRIPPFHSEVDDVNPLASAQGQELIPEFFFFDDFLIGTELPKWCDGAADFIHKHRTALATGHVSQRMSQWIDQIWGCKQLKTQSASIEIPQQLFRTPHVPRTVFSSAFESSEVITIGNLDGNVLCCCGGGSPPSAFRIHALLDSYRLYELKVDGTRKEIPPKARSLGFLEFPVLSASYLLFAQNLRQRIARLDFSTFKITFSDTAAEIALVSAIAASGQHVIVGGVDGSVSFWLLSMPLFDIVKSMIVHTDTVTAVTVSTDYGIAVSCAQDNTAVVTLLPQLLHIRTFGIFEKGIVATHVLVTEAMGYIVIVGEGNGKHLLENFTLNGNFNRRREFDFQTRGICALTSQTGFDFVAIVNANSQLLLVDGFSLDAVRVIYQGEGMRSVQFCQSLRAFLVTCDNSSILVIPFEFP